MHNHRYGRLFLVSLIAKTYCLNVVFALVWCNNFYTSMPHALLFIVRTIWGLTTDMHHRRYNESPCMDEWVSASLRVQVLWCLELQVSFTQVCKLPVLVYVHYTILNSIYNIVYNMQMTKSHVNIIFEWVS